MASKPSVTIVHLPVKGVQSSRKPGKAGRRLWQKLSRDIDERDDIRREILRQACDIADRLAEARVCIERDGITVAGRGGILKVHPCVNLEAMLRSTLMRFLRQLLPAQPKRPPGRPGYGGIGITYEDIEKWQR